MELLPYPGLEAQLLLNVPTKGCGCGSPYHSLAPIVMVLWQEPELISMLEPSPEAHSFLTLASQSIFTFKRAMLLGDSLDWTAYLHQEQVNSAFKKRSPSLFAWEKRILCIYKGKATTHQSIPRWPLRRTKGSWFFKSRVCKLEVTSKWLLSW